MFKSRLWLALAFSIAVPTFFSGCSEEEPPPFVLPEAPEERVVDDVVVSACTSHVQCPLEFPVCDKDAEWCVECTSDTHCPQDETCVDQECHGEVRCEAGTSVCNGNVIWSCSEDGEDYEVIACPTLCKDGHCVDCAPGVKRCDEDTVEVCDDDGLGWHKEQDCWEQGSGLICMAGECIDG